MQPTVGYYLVTIRCAVYCNKQFIIILYSNSVSVDLSTLRKRNASLSLWQNISDGFAVNSEAICRQKLQVICVF